MLLEGLSGEILSFSTRLGVVGFTESFFIAESFALVDLEFTSDSSVGSAFAFLGRAFVVSFERLVFLGTEFYLIDLRGIEVTCFFSVIVEVFSAVAADLGFCIAV